MYWVVLALLKLAEGFADNFVFWWVEYRECFSVINTVVKTVVKTVV